MMSRQQIYMGCSVFVLDGWDHESTGVHSIIVKLNTMCEQKQSTFSKLHRQNMSKFYQFFFHE